MYTLARFLAKNVESATLRLQNDDAVLFFVPRKESVLDRWSTESARRWERQCSILQENRKMLMEMTGSFSLVLERHFPPFPIQQLLLLSDLEILFNRGRMLVGWDKNILASNLKMSSEGSGTNGFVVFSSHALLQSQRNILSPPMNKLICIFSEEEPGDGDWAYGSFPLEEYIKALDRSKGELYYNHSLGMRYSQIMEQIYAGSCRS